MNRLAIVLLVPAALSLPASAQQSAPASNVVQNVQDAAHGTVPSGKDRIGLTDTQRQMIAWSIAGFADMQPVPQNFQPKPGTKAPKKLKLSQVPAIIEGVAPPAASYQYAMLADKDLLLVRPQDSTIADVIHLNRRL